jgi:hypothetical protein
LAALLLAVCGCALAFDSTKLGVPVSLADSAQATVQGAPFRVVKHPAFVFWGMATASQPNLEDVLAGQTGAGTRITNLRIRIRARWSDVLVTVLTVGIVSPRTVTFEGVVVGP